jgi:hypothetical protein
LGREFGICCRILVCAHDALESYGTRSRMIVFVRSLIAPLREPAQAARQTVSLHTSDSMAMLCSTHHPSDNSPSYPSPDSLHVWQNSQYSRFATPQLSPAPSIEPDHRLHDHHPKRNSISLLSHRSGAAELGGLHHSRRASLCRRICRLC